MLQILINLAKATQLISNEAKTQSSDPQGNTPSTQRYHLTLSLETGTTEFSNLFISLTFSVGHPYVDGYF